MGAMGYMKMTRRERNLFRKLKMSIRYKNEPAMRAYYEGLKDEWSHQIQKKGAK